MRRTAIGLAIVVTLASVYLLGTRAWADAVPAASRQEIAAGAPAQRPQPAAPGQRVEVPPPPFSDGIFPCSACHNASMPPNRTRRQLSEMHTDIDLRHDEEHRWCL